MIYTRLSSHSRSILMGFCEVMWSDCFKRFISAVRIVIKLSAFVFVGSQRFAGPQETCARNYLFAFAFFRQTDKKKRRRKSSKDPWDVIIQPVTGMSLSGYKTVCILNG